MRRSCRLPHTSACHSGMRVGHIRHLDGATAERGCRVEGRVCDDKPAGSGGQARVSCRLENWPACARAQSTLRFSTRVTQAAVWVMQGKQGRAWLVSASWPRQRPMSTRPRRQGRTSTVTAHDRWVKQPVERAPNAIR